MKKVNIEPIMFSRKGAGRIDDSIPIDLLEYVTPRSEMAIDNTPVCYIPKQISVSEEISGTIYDVTKIEVFDSTKDENGKKHVPIKVHFIGVGVIVIPDGKTILETYEEIRKNPPSAA